MSLPSPSHSLSFRQAKKLLTAYGRQKFPKLSPEDLNQSIDLVLHEVMRRSDRDLAKYVWMHIEIESVAENVLLLANTPESRLFAVSVRSGVSASTENRPPAGIVPFILKKVTAAPFSFLKYRLRNAILRDEIYPERKQAKSAQLLYAHMSPSRRGATRRDVDKYSTESSEAGEAKMARLMRNALATMERKSPRRADLARKYLFVDEIDMKTVATAEGVTVAAVSNALAELRRCFQAESRITLSKRPPCRGEGPRPITSDKKKMM